MPKAVLRWLGLAGLVIVLDQITKQVVLGAFAPGEGREITPFFNLVLVYNRGAAFSFLAEAGGWQKWFFLALALAISAWIIGMLRRHAGERLLCLALSLILGGALGNVIDRVLYGAVVDFLDIHAAGWHWPAFNVADSAITVGAALLVWEQLFMARTKNAKEAQS
ncbi:MAG TPA: signal peptidase II [Rhodocyclaceae bacterium]|nr:signal peptidase II [Rhodocyclaceae bacterium]